jgi:hypothetical protein
LPHHHSTWLVSASFRSPLFSWLQAFTYAKLKGIWRIVKFKMRSKHCSWGIYCNVFISWLSSTTIFCVYHMAMDILHCELSSSLSISKIHSTKYQ